MEQNPEISFSMILCKHLDMAIAIDGNIICALPMAICTANGNVHCQCNGNVIRTLLTDSRLRLSLRLAHVMSNPTDFCRHLKRHCHQNQIKKTWSSKSNKKRYRHQNQIKNVRRYSRVSLNHIPPARTHDAGRRARLLVSVFCLKKVFLIQPEPVRTSLN